MKLLFDKDTVKDKYCYLHLIQSIAFYGNMYYLLIFCRINFKNI